MQEQLNEALLELENLNSMFINQKNVADAMLHFVFLFASPLVAKHGGEESDKYKTKELLEFKKEFKEIKDSIRETSRVVKIKSMQATIENMTKMLT